MPAKVARPYRIALALIAIAVTAGVHGTWISDLAVIDTRGPAIAA
jgi:hypothetical protein